MTLRLAFLALVGVLMGFVLACGLLAPVNSPRADAFDCRQAALEPIFGEILDTKAFLRDLYAGRGDLSSALGAAGATRAEFLAFMRAWEACDAPAEAPDAGLTPS